MEKIESKEFTWYHFDDNNEDVVKHLKKQFDFHELDIEDVASGPQQPKADFYKDYLFAIFHFPDYQSEEHRIHVIEMDVFLSKNFLITVNEGAPLMSFVPGLKESPHTAMTLFTRSLLKRSKAREEAYIFNAGAYIPCPSQSIVNSSEILTLCLRRSSIKNMTRSLNFSTRTDRIIKDDPKLGHCIVCPPRTAVIKLIANLLNIFGAAYPKIGLDLLNPSFKFFVKNTSESVFSI